MKDVYDEKPVYATSSPPSHSPESHGQKKDPREKIAAMLRMRSSRSNEAQRCFTFATMRRW